MIHLSHLVQLLFLPHLVLILLLAFQSILLVDRLVRTNLPFLVLSLFRERVNTVPIEANIQ